MHDNAPLQALLLTALGLTGLKTAVTEVRAHRRAPRDAAPAVVVSGVEMVLLDERDGQTAVHADLIFDPADPFAVTAVFRAHAQRVAWTFARDLLAHGLYAPLGDGDVHVWPCLSSSGTAVVVFELDSPEGEVMLQAESQAVAQFVQQMLAAVPNGRETAHVDLDSELARIVSSGPAEARRGRRDTD